MKAKVRIPFIPNAPHNSKMHNQGVIYTYTINLLIHNTNKRGG